MGEESIIHENYVDNDLDIPSDIENSDSDSNSSIHERIRPRVMMMLSSDEEDGRENDLEDANIKLDWSDNKISRNNQPFEGLSGVTFAADITSPEGIAEKFIGDDLFEVIAKETNRYHYQNTNRYKQQIKSKKWVDVTVSEYESLVQKLQLQHLNISYGIVSQSNQDGVNSINEKLVKIIEDSRDQFEQGFPNLGIPPLDPVKIPKINFYVYQKGIIRSSIDLFDIVITGIREFIIDDLSFQLNDMMLKFDINIPELIFTSKYASNGKVAKVIPFKPKGNAWIEMQDITVKGVANLQKANGSLNIKAFHISLDVGKTKVNFSGLLGNGFVNKILNWVLNRLSDRVVQTQKDNLADSIAAEIMDVANSILKNISLMDLVAA